MGTKGIFPLSPTDISKTVWFYQQRKGLCVVAQLVEKDGTVLGTTIADIPWRRLLPAFKNYQKYKRKYRRQTTS